MQDREAPSSALLGFIGAGLSWRIKRQEKHFLLFGGHVPANDFLEPKLDFFMSQGFFVVEWGSHTGRDFMTG